jgi:carbonic anhydrase
VGDKFEGASQKLGDVFTARVGETFVTFNITEFIPDSKIVWTFTNCYFPWLRDKTEWMGTKIIFEVSNENNLTTINLTHLGLVPKNEGYDNFVKGWKVYVQGSLLKLLNEGIGQPT